MLNQKEAHDWKILAVSIDENPEKWRRAAQKPELRDTLGNIMHILPDSIPQVRQAYQVERISRSVFINPNREIEWLDVKVTGEYEDLKKRLQQLFCKEGVKHY